METRGHDQESPSAGQTMVFMVMALIILSFVILFNLDLHTILRVKQRTQNAGDGAALAAARWQGISLNLIGDLNIMQAVALSVGDSDTAALIPDLQARLCYAGPAIALLAAQQAAKNNGIYVSAGFSQRLGEHATNVIAAYPDVFLNQPYSNCWAEYGAMLEALAQQGIAAAPDNAQFYYQYSGGHTLLEMPFYQAVAGQDWCWFYWNDYTLLQTYTDYLCWPDLPPLIPQSSPVNSEIFGLGLYPRSMQLDNPAVIPLMSTLGQARELTDRPVSNAVAQITATWYCYEPGRWRDWTNLSVLPVFDDANNRILPQYDYMGADVAVRIEAAADRLTPGQSASLITWTAAAKPFGYLDAGGTPVRPDQYGVVLPAFHNTRLFPVDASSLPQGGAFDLAWQEHIEVHLLPYLESGLDALNAGCWYCRQLITWESPTFRQTGIDWLALTNAVTGELVNDCYEPGPPGGGPGGGTRRGH